MAEDIRWEEEMLEELARAVAYPAAPDFRAAVMVRLPQAAPARAVSPSRSAAAGIAALLLVMALVVAVSRDAREAIAEFLGLAVEGERIEILPTAPAGTTATPFPTAVTLDQIAEKVPRAEVAGRAGFEPVLPASLGEPAAFYLIRVENRSVVIADYGKTQIWEFPLDAGVFIGKGIPVGGGTIVAPVTVNGQPGYWIEGGERVVTVNGPDGTPRSGTQRIVLSQALIWSEGGLYRRVEGVASRAEALGLAAEMR